MTPEAIDELKDRMAELDKQCAERATLYRLMGSTEIADEFERLRTSELAPMIAILNDE